MAKGNLSTNSGTFFVQRVWTKCTSVHAQKPSGHIDFDQVNVALEREIEFSSLVPR